MSNKVAEIGDEIYRELGEPSELSIAAISFWLRTNIGYLNASLGTDFSVDTGDVSDGRDYEISPRLNEMEKVIFKLTYHVYHYDVKIREILTTASTDAVIELESDGSRIRKTNKVDQSRTYLKAREFRSIELVRLTMEYKRGNVVPVQVAGNDTIEATFALNRQYNRVRSTY